MSGSVAFQWEVKIREDLAQNPQPWLNWIANQILTATELTKLELQVTQGAQPSPYRLQV